MVTLSLHSAAASRPAGKRIAIRLVRVACAVLLFAGLLLTSTAALADGEDLTGSKWLWDYVPYVFHHGKPGETVKLGQYDPEGKDPPDPVTYEGTYDGKTLVLNHINIGPYVTERITAQISQDGRTITGSQQIVASLKRMSETNPITFIRTDRSISGSSGGGTTTTPDPPTVGSSGGGTTTPNAPILGSSGGGATTPNAPILGSSGGGTTTPDPPTVGSSGGGTTTPDYPSYSHDTFEPNPLIKLMLTGGIGLGGLALGSALAKPKPATNQNENLVCNRIRQLLTQEIPTEVKQAQAEYALRQQQRERELVQIFDQRHSNYVCLLELGKTGTEIDQQMSTVAQVAWLFSKSSDLVVSTGVSLAMNKLITLLKTANVASGLAGSTGAVAVETNSAIATITSALPAIEGAAITASATQASLYGRTAVMAFALMTFMSMELSKTGLTDSLTSLINVPGISDLNNMQVALTDLLKKFKEHHARDFAEFRRLDQKLTQLRSDSIKDTKNTNESLLRHWEHSARLIEEAELHSCGPAQMPFLSAPEVTNTLDMNYDPIHPDDLERLQDGNLPRSYDYFRLFQ